MASRWPWPLALLLLPAAAHAVAWPFARPLAAHLRAASVSSPRVRTCNDAEVQRFAFLTTYGPLEGYGPPPPEPPRCAPRQEKRLSLARIGAAAKAPKARSGQPYFVQLSVVMVSAEWCPPPCQAVTWEVAALKPPKGDQSYQLLELCVWLDERRITLYEFDEAWYDAAKSAYHDLCGGTSWTCPEVAMHRESAKLYEAKWDSRLNDTGLSSFLAKHADEALRMVHARNGTHTGLSYSGHGSRADGSLFEGVILAQDVGIALQRATGQHRFSLIDFGGNCAEGRWNNLEIMQPFTKYLIASDLKVGGLTLPGADEDDAHIKEYLRLHALYTSTNHRLTLLQGQPTMSELGAGLLDGERKLWDFEQTTIATHQSKQSKALFDMDSFLDLHTAMEGAWSAASVDERSAAVRNSSTSMCDVRNFSNQLGGTVLETAYLTMRVNYISTANMFQWDKVTHGLGFNYLGFHEPPCDISPAVGGSQGRQICLAPPGISTADVYGGGCEAYGEDGPRHEACNVCMTDDCDLRYEEVCHQCGYCVALDAVALTA